MKTMRGLKVVKFFVSLFMYMALAVVNVVNVYITKYVVDFNSINTILILGGFIFFMKIFDDFKKKVDDYFKKKETEITKTKKDDTVVVIEVDDINKVNTATLNRLKKTYGTNYKIVEKKNA